MGISLPRQPAQFLIQIEELACFEGMDVHLEELTLHPQQIDHIFRIGQVFEGGAQAGFQQGIHPAHVAFGVDHPWTNDELVGWKVDIAVGVGPGIGFRGAGSC